MSGKPTQWRGRRFLRQAGVWAAVLLAAYSLGTLGVLLFSDKVAKSVGDAPWWLVPAAVGFATLAFSLRATRWVLLARSLKLPLTPGQLVQVYLGGFVMNLTPGRVGELWRAWILQRGWQVRYAKGLPMSFTDRFLDLNTLLLFVACGAMLNGQFALLAWFALGALALLLALLLLPGWARLALKYTWGLLGKPLPQIFAELHAVLRNLGNMFSLRRYLALLAISVLAWGCEVIGIATLANVLQESAAISLPAAAATLGIANIGGALTHLPAGIGGQELAMGHFLTVAGMQMENATVLVGAMRLGTLWYSVLLGLPFFIHLTRRHARAQ